MAFSQDCDECRWEWCESCELYDTPIACDEHSEDEE